MDFEHPKHQRESFCTPLTQRQFFPAELEALLHYNGFEVESHSGDFEAQGSRRESSKTWTRTGALPVAGSTSRS